MQQDLNKPSLQQQLDGLEELPTGYSFDAAAIWSRLEERLPQQKRKRKAYWYAAAAAVVMLFASVVTYFFLNREAVPQPMLSAAPAWQQPAVAPAPPADNSPSVPTNVAPKRTAVESSTTQQAPLYQTATEVVAVVPSPEVKTDRVLPIEQVDTASKTIVAVPAVKATLAAPARKVVHINELLAEYQLEQQRVADVQRNHKSLEEEISIEKNTEPIRPWWFRKSKHTAPLKNQ